MLYGSKLHIQLPAIIQLLNRARQFKFWKLNFLNKNFLREKQWEEWAISRRIKKKREEKKNDQQEEVDGRLRW